MTALILLSEWRRIEIELWRPVRGCSGYEVSNLGRLRSFWRKSGSAKSFAASVSRLHGTWTYVLSDTPSLLGFGTDKDGYKHVDLRYASGRYKRGRIHRLVAGAFIPNARLGVAIKINHLNNVHDDNRAANLEWCTEKENRDHAIAIGVWPKGERHYNARLTSDNVREIRRRYAGGESHVSIARDFGITTSASSQIAKRKLWKDVE